jgi:hypothetical protein
VISRPYPSSRRELESAKLDKCYRRGGCVSSEKVFIAAIGGVAMGLAWKSTMNPSPPETTAKTYPNASPQAPPEAPPKVNPKPPEKKLTHFQLDSVKSFAGRGYETYIRLTLMNPSATVNTVNVKIIPIEGSGITYNAGSLKPGNPMTITGEDLVKTVT